MFDIRLEGKQPIYEQLYSGITALIASGSLSPEEKLPAVREVAKKLGVNPNTVQKAYAMLEQKGFIYSVPAKGSYVSPKTGAAKALQKEKLKRLSEALTEAKTSGIEREEIFRITNEIWGDKASKTEERNETK